MTGEDTRLTGHSFTYIFYACLSMGLLYYWINLIGSFGGSSLASSPFGGSAEMVPYNILNRAAIGLAFLGFSLTPQFIANERTATISSGILALVGTVTCWCSSPAEPFVLAAGNVVSGTAFALFNIVWLARYRRDAGDLFIMLLLASGVTGLAYPYVSYVGGVAPFVVSALLPVGAVLLFLYTPGEKLRTYAPEPSAAAAPNRTHVAVQAAVLLLCNFASGPAAYGMLTSVVGSAPHIAGIVSFALVAVLGLCKNLRDEAFLACAAFAVCLCIAPALIFDSVPRWLPLLTSAAFWIITKYSIAWFTLNGGEARQGLSPLSLRGLAAVYLLTAVAEVVGMQVPHQTACAIALATVGGALAIALVNATRNSSTGTGAATSAANPSMGSVGDSVHEIPVTRSASVLDELAAKASLTESERSVFERLARGYSLKEIARQLNLTEGGAKYHRHNVYQKLGVASRQELINLVEAHEGARG